MAPGRRKKSRRGSTKRTILTVFQRKKPDSAQRNKMHSADQNNNERKKEGKRSKEGSVFVRGGNGGKNGVSKPKNLSAKRPAQGASSRPGRLIEKGTKKKKTKNARKHKKDKKKQKKHEQ